MDSGNRMRSEIILVIAAMGLVTFITRFSFIAISRRINFSERALNVMRYVPIAILSALIAPAVFAPNGQVNLSVGNDYIWASLLSALIAYKTRNAFLTVFAGMAVIIINRIATGALN